MVDTAAIGVSSLLVLSTLTWFFIQQRKTKNTVKPLSVFERLDRALDQLEAEAQNKIKSIEELDKSEKNDKEKLEYRYSFEQEELLKLLIKLDGVELVHEDLHEDDYLKLKTKRKNTIKAIQSSIKQLDSLKKALFVAES